MKIWSDDIELDKIALKNENQIVTYRQLEAFCKETTTVMIPRSVALVYSDNSLETVQLCCALLYNDIVPIMLGADSRNADKKILEDYRPTYIFSKEKEEFKPQLSYTVVLKIGEYCLYRTNFETYEIYEELALLLLTSGSTGSAKCVRLSQLNLQKSFEYHIDCFDISNSDKYIRIAEMSHVLGWAVLFSYLTIGATVLLPSYGILHTKWVEFFLRETPDSFACVPYTLEMLTKIGFFEKISDDYMYKSVILAGAKMNKKLLQELPQKIKEVLKFGYGQTEATGLIASCKYYDIVNKNESCIGKIKKAYVKAEIQEDGTLDIKSLNVCLGYAQNYLDLRKENENHYELNTGDIVTVYEDGNYFLEGRVNRFIKILGIRYNLDDIQLFLQEEFFEVEFAIMGEENLIIIYLSKYTHLDKNTLKNYLHINMGIPNSYIVERTIQSIPRTSSGKIQYSKLKK